MTVIENLCIADCLGENASELESA